MTALLDPAHRQDTSRPGAPTTLPTTAIPAARRSSPDRFRTAPIAPTPEAGLDTGERPTPAEHGMRRRAALLGAAFVLVAVATAVGLSAPTPLSPLPIPPPPPVVVPGPTAAACSGASCMGLDPTSQGCQQDARTVASRIVTAEHRGIEVPIGAVDVRASAACGAVWARYALDPTAPVGEVAIESRAGTSTHAPIDALAGHRHVGYGTTPMLAVSADSVRAVVIPSPGGELPSRATAWTG